MGLDLGIFKGFQETLHLCIGVEPDGHGTFSAGAAFQRDILLEIFADMLQDAEILVRKLLGVFRAADVVLTQQLADLVLQLADGQAALDRQA
jgi:hypothetical protein